MSHHILLLIRSTQHFSEALSNVSSVLILPLLALCLFSSVSAADDDTGTKSVDQQHGDPSTVDLYLQNHLGQGVLLRIPTDYLKQRDLDGGLTNRLTVYLEFPEMTPRSKDHLSVSELFAQLDAQLNDDAPVGDNQNERAEHTYQGRVTMVATIPNGSKNRMERTILASPERLDEANTEFRYFRRTDSKTGRVNFDFLVPRDQFNAPRPLTITCIGGQFTHPDGGKCSVFTQLSDRLQVEYTIPLRQAAQWRAIQARVRAWVGALVSGCFEGPQLQPGDTPSNIHSCPL